MNAMPLAHPQAKRKRFISDVDWIFDYIAKGQMDAAADLFKKRGSAVGKEIENITGPLSPASRKILLALDKFCEFPKSDYRNKQALGELEFHSGRLSHAVRCFKEVLLIAPDQIDALIFLSRANLALGQIDQAISNLEAAARLGFAQPEIHVELGQILLSKGDTAKSIKSFVTAISLNKRDFNAFFNLGNAYKSLDRLEDAVGAFSQSLEINPQHAESYNNRGATFQVLSRDREAIADFNNALKINGRHLYAYINKGVSLYKVGQYGASIQAFDMALAINPSLGEIYHNLGLALLKLDRGADALAVFETAMLVDPQKQQWLLSKGNALDSMHRYEEAVAVYREAIAKSPTSTDAHINMAGALQELARHQDAIEILDKALESKPGYSEALWNKSNSMLAYGPSREAWEAYEHRLHLSVGEKLPDFGLPLLGSADPRGRKLLIQWEQRFGDVIEMLRYAPQLQEICECHWQVAPPLMDLVKASFPSLSICALDECPPGLDTRMPYTSLPLAAKTFSIAAIPSQIPYLRPSLAARGKWQSVLDKGSVNIGVTWRGNAKPPGRTIPIEVVAPIFAQPGVNWVSLQTDVSSKEERILEKFGISDLGGDIKSFDDSAALMTECDLVISIDTAVAHLAGALGRETWILLKYGCDWRWLLKRSDCPWYPTARLYRQEKLGHWSAVVDRVCKDLAQKFTEN
jgi:tetratricopeptide (TPR) repeat protein